MSELVRMKRMVLVVLALPLGLMLALWHLSATWAWVGSFELCVTVGLGAAMLGTCIATWRRMQRTAIAIASLLLVANTVFLIALLCGARLIPLPTPDTRFAVVLCATTLLGVAGLVARRQWARWLCVALAAAGIGCGTLNAINFWSVSATPRPEYLVWYLDVCRTTWVYCVTALGGATIIVNLVAARSTFVAPEAWTRPEPVVRALRFAMIAAFAAAPMLLVYAWTQPVVAATRPSALILAALLAISTALAVRGRLVGALLLVATGLGLAAQTIATLSLASTSESVRIASYYSVFWSPAALTAIVSGCLMIRPIARLLRRRGVDGTA